MFIVKWAVRYLPISMLQNEQLRFCVWDTGNGQIIQVLKTLVFRMFYTLFTNTKHHIFDTYSAWNASSGQGEDGLRFIFSRKRRTNTYQHYIYKLSWILSARDDGRSKPHASYHMMTSSNGSIFRVTGHLCGEFTGHRWFLHTKASDAELWCFLLSAPD